MRMFILALTLLAVKASADGLKLQSCSMPDFDFYGGDIDMVDDVMSSNDCRQLCETSDKCEAWSWIEAAQANGAPPLRCHLKNLSKVQRNGKQTGVVSGLKGGCCAQFGTDYPTIGNGLMTQAVDSWQACGRMCLSDDACQAWSWTSGQVESTNAEAHKCHHKTSGIKGIDGVKVQNVISGTKTCCKDTILMDTDFEGSDLRPFFFDLTWDQCAKKCKETQECRAWSVTYKNGVSRHNIPKGKCHLKDRTFAKGDNKRQNMDGMISGNKGCPGNGADEERQFRPPYGRLDKMGQSVQLQPDEERTKYADLSDDMKKRAQQWLSGGK